MINDTILLLEKMNKAIPIKNECCIIYRNGAIELRWQFSIKEKNHGYSQILSRDDTRIIPDDNLLELLFSQLRFQLKEAENASKS